MCCERAKVFVILSFGLILIFSCYLPAKTHPSINYGAIDSSQDFRTLSPLLSRKTNDTFITLNEQTNSRSRNSFSDKEYDTEMHKRINLLPFDKNIGQYKDKNVVPKINRLNSRLYRAAPSAPLNLQSNFIEKEKAWPWQLLNKRLVKRNASVRKGIPREKQKKAKALGRLLMNNDPNKNNEDIQDDYIEDEDDAYFGSVNKKKMNWEAFRNEDGASVMELIALNARHKTNMYSTDNEEYLYR